VDRHPATVWLARDARVVQVRTRVLTQKKRHKTG
jgi:hypothetical protein